MNCFRPCRTKIVYIDLKKHLVFEIYGVGSDNDGVFLVDVDSIKVMDGYNDTLYTICEKSDRRISALHHRGMVGIRSPQSVIQILAI